MKSCFKKEEFIEAKEELAILKEHLEK